MTRTDKYSDQFMHWLSELGYTHCFFVGGGNVMHLLESASKKFKCIPVVHEVAAGISAEYFNEVSSNGNRAFALVTAGPGLTNIVTAIGGAYLESRELLVVGGQAKTSDLARGLVPQIGHQEIAGVAIVEPITKYSVLADRRLTRSEVERATAISRTGRKGPVFIEMCLDITAMPALDFDDSKLIPHISPPAPTTSDMAKVKQLLSKSKRPLLLLGGGVPRGVSEKLLSKFEELKLPVATTWNGFDRISYDFKYYAGRPNTYGMRWANIINQSSDLVIAVGTRLGIQQIGFAWEDFVPKGKVVQVDIDFAELQKGFPNTELAICSDSVEFLSNLFTERLQLSVEPEWVDFIQEIRDGLDYPDPQNLAKGNFVELHKFIRELSERLTSQDVIVPCSSGGTFNAVMQMFKHKQGQKVVTNKSLASMGYGLAGAIGASFAEPKRRVVLMEGDGGFAQNLQELGTVAVNKLNIKIFITSNRGYASIRMTQKSYFEGNYVGCDELTGLGLPKWKSIFDAYGIPCFEINSNNLWDKEIIEALENSSPMGFIVNLDPEELFYPKVTSALQADGTMKTNPIHLMTPPLGQELETRFMRFLRD